MNTIYISNAQVLTQHKLLPNATIVVHDGRIATITTQPADCPSGAQRLDARGNLILPGFIDLHVHGGHGFDVMDGTIEALHGLAAHLAAHGVTGFLATTVTASLADTLAVAAVVRQARSMPIPGAAILGMHIEGPYINPKRSGAQNMAHIRLPSVAEMEQIIAASGDSVRIVTLAPELEGGHEFIAFLQRRGIIASLGHSDATYEQTLAALDVGVTHITHLFNAMRPFHHREPGMIGVALTDQRAMVELIADGLHVHPSAVRLVLQARGAERIVLISDAMRGAGLPYGCYFLSGRTVYTSENGARTADGTLAGSLLTLEVALRNVLNWTGLPLQHAWVMTSLNQARELGLEARKGSIEVGKDADLVICTPTFEVLTTMVGGRIVYSKDG